MRTTFLFLLALPLSLFGSGVGSLTDDSDPGTQEGPMQNAFSSNWIATVTAALPAQYATRRNLKFQQITNYLCEESGRGNKAAEVLWGTVLISQSRSPEESTNGLQLLQDSANKGYTPAMVYLGGIYENGQYVPTNYDQAFHWFSLAAAAGDADGELQLGSCYHYGFGTAPDQTKTAQLYRLAAMQTNYVAMKSLGYVLMNGRGTPADVEAAKYWFTRAAKEGGNRRAMYNLAGIYAAKSPDTNAMAQAFQWYQRSAELGDALGCLQLAECYRYGWGTETNLAGYREWIYNAARLGATEAQCEMGLAYQLGDGVPMDTETALIWYRKAAAKNDPDALYNMGMYYLKNIEQPPYRQAYDCLVRSADAGSSAAQYECAILNFIGDIGPPDFEKGKQWLTEAANNGWSRAEFNLFSFYYNGISPAAGLPKFPQDKIEAVKWLRRAAEHGHLQAQDYLGLMLVQGITVQQDTAEAGKWLRNAAEHGYTPAQNDLGYAILHGDIDSADPLEAATWCELAKAHWTNPKTQHIIDANLSGALSQLKPDEQQEVARRVKDFRPLPTPEGDPLVKGWEKNPNYQQEDGRFGH